MSKSNVLVIRFSSLGDVILTTPVLREIKTAWPDATVDVLTRREYADVFSGDPHVSSIRTFTRDRDSFFQAVKEIRRARYDVIVDLQGNFRSWFVRLMAVAKRTVKSPKMALERRALVLTKYQAPGMDRSVRDRYLDALRNLGIKPVSADTELFLTKGPEILDSFGLDPTWKLIGVAPGAKHRTKRWKADRFAEAANRFGDMAESMIVLLGGKEDRAAADEVIKDLSVPFVDLVGKTDIEQLKHVTARLSLLLTNDSGLMHMAEAFGIPLVAIFGPTVRAFGFAPYRPTSRVVEMSNLSCRPCSLHGTDVCPLKHHHCMEEVDLNAVVFAASAALESSGASGREISA